MSVVSIQEIGLSPLEVTPLQTGPYIEYWSDTYPAAISKLAPIDKDGLDRMQSTARFITKVSNTVIRNGDPEFINGSRRKYGGVIAAWDKNLGSLNAMAGGQGDMLRAASILMEENIDPDQDEIMWAPPSDTRNAYKSFTSVVRTNDAIRIH